MFGSEWAAWSYLESKRVDRQQARRANVALAQMVATFIGVLTFTLLVLS